MACPSRNSTITCEFPGENVRVRGLQQMKKLMISCNHSVPTVQIFPQKLRVNLSKSVTDASQTENVH